MKSLLTDCKEGGMMIYPGADGVSHEKGSQKGQK